MKVSEMIEKLQQFAEEHGDLECESSFLGDRVSNGGPELKHRKILKGRETKPRFWYRGDGEDRKGEPVCKL